MSSPAPEPRLEVSWAAGRIIARIADCHTLSEFNLESISAHLSWLVDGRTRQHLVIDLTNIDFLSSSALGKFVDINRKLRAAGGHLTLVTTSPEILKTLSLTGLDRLIEVWSSPDGDPDLRSLGSI
jgi:anti-anti-sigma factor